MILLDRPLNKKPMTKNQMAAEFCNVVFFSKKKKKKKKRGQPDVISFQKETIKKGFSRYLVFSHWFLVTSLSNEKDVEVLST